jgi:hypothetical protein
MELNWRAVILGFLVTLVLGFINGVVFVGSDATVVLLYWGAIGLLGGLTAGYIAGGTWSTGALNGGVATVLGSLIVLGIATLSGLLFAGIIPTLGMVTFSLLVLAFYAVPGVVGGAIGSWAKGRRTARETRAVHG